MSKFIRTSKGYINSMYIVKVEVKGDDALVFYMSGGGETTAEVKGSEDIREMRTILELPFPRMEGYTGDTILEYPESTSSRSKK